MMLTLWNILQAEITGETIITPNTTESRWTPAAAFDGTDTYLAVWAQGSGILNGESDIYATRIKGDGTILDVTPILISSAVDLQKKPRAAWNGSEWLVVWQDLRNGNDYDIYAARLSSAGTMLDPNGIAVCTAAMDQVLPNVASDGHDFLVVWSDYRDSASYNLYGTILHSDGSPTTATLLASTPAEELDGTPVWTGTSYLVGCAKSWASYGRSSIGQFTILVGADGIPKGLLKTCGTNFQSSECNMAMAGNHLVLTTRFCNGKRSDPNVFLGFLLDTLGNELVNNNASRGYYSNDGMAYSGPRPVSLNNNPALSDPCVNSGSIAGSGIFFVAVHEMSNNGDWRSANQRSILSYQLLDAVDAHVSEEGILTSAGDQNKSPSVCGGPNGSFLVLYERSNAADSIQPIGFRIVKTDATPPTAPADLQASNVEAHTVCFNWKKSSDPESGISGYLIFRNSTLVAQVTDTSFTDIDLTENTDYAYEVQAINGVKLVSAKSALSVKTLVDNVPPTIVAASAASDKTEILVIFSEIMDETSAETPGNYALNLGKSITGATLQADKKCVILSCNTLLSPATTYELTVGQIKDASVAANTIAANTVVQFTVAKLPLVITNGTMPSSWAWDVVAIGKLKYVDVSYGAFTNVPSKYIGLPYLKTSNSNETITRTGDSVYTFTLSKEAMVYITYDNNQYNANHRPTWLVNNYTDNGDDIDNRSVWEKRCPAGLVKLGGCAGDANYSMYTVIVRPLDSSDVVISSEEKPDTTASFSEGLTAQPNPFNPQLNLVLQCKASRMMTKVALSTIKMDIYNPAGKKVAGLTPKRITQAGNQTRLEYSWNGGNYASGVFVVMARAYGKTWKKKVVLVK